MSESMSYTSRDVVDIRKALVDLVPTLTDKWKDFNESDVGMTIIELIAGAQDMQNFYFDTQAFETYLDTAVQEKNIRSILRSMNFRIPLIGSARGHVRVTYRDIEEGTNVYIPKYTEFVCSNNRRKYVASDAVSVTLNGDGYVDVPVVEGELREKVVTKKSLCSNLTPSGNPSRRIGLDLTTVAEHTVEICQDGVIWEEVDDALLAYEGGRVFSTHKDSDNKVYILMSCNFVDLLPEDEDEKITIKFVVSSGLAGEVDIGEIDTIVGTDLIGNVESVSNLRRTYGAWDEIDLNRAKILARKNAMTMDRYITLDDFKTALEIEPYVKSCVVKDWRVDSSIPQPYLIKIWAVDWNGNSLGDYFVEEISKKLYEKGVTDVDVQFQRVECLEFDIDVSVTLKTTTEKDALSVLKLIEDRLSVMYGVSYMEFGKEISLGLLISDIRGISPYIKDVIINYPNGDVIPTDVQFPKLRNISVGIAK